ncbi:hypothetical protein AAHH80_41615, partial [Burkholderia pseudomallei]
LRAPPSRLSATHRRSLRSLPRPRPPRGYYDLVGQVSIVRPGPIQGGAVHPYLARRRIAAGEAHGEITYPSEALERV